MLYARPAGNGISKNFGVQRSLDPHGVSSCGAIERSRH